LVPVRSYYTAAAVILATGLLAFPSVVEAAGLVIHGQSGPGKGKSIVLIAGDDEYHSEEMIPELAKILAQRHGFDCTVLFSTNPVDGTIDPHEKRNIPGLEALDTADLLVIFTRFRDLPDDQMKHVNAYIESGKPVIGLRTATHAFEIKTSPTYERYSWDSKAPGWEGGFGRRVLGETWIAHHGKHGRESTRGLFAPGSDHSPILRGIQNGEIWVPTDVYEIRLPQPTTCTPLLLGQVLSGMKPEDKPVTGKVNDPMMPVAWTNTYTAESGKTGRAFVTTLASADSFESEALRRLIVNAAYWAVGLAVPSHANVSLIDSYHPRSFLDTEYTHGLQPSDLAR
jgi:type 1 glutamine amidotransferase